MSLSDRLKDAFKRYKGKGVAAAVAVNVDLSAARDKAPWQLEGSGVAVEFCSGDLYVFFNGPNGDGLNLRYVREVTHPFSQLFLSNVAQAGLGARLLLLPFGLKARADARIREDAVSLSGTVSIGAGAGALLISGVAGKRIKIFDAGFDALTAGLHLLYFGTSAVLTGRGFCTRQTSNGYIHQTFVTPRVSNAGDGLYVYSAVAETNLPYDLAYAQE